MMLSQITCNLRKSLNSHVTSRYTNCICRARMKEHLRHEVAFYCAQREKPKLSAQLDKVANLNVNKSRGTELNCITQDREQYDTQTLSSPEFGALKKSIEKLYPQPLADLMSIYDAVCREFHKKCMSVVYDDLKNPPHERMKCTINVTWPYQRSFSNAASNKRAAARNAALMCLNWLYSQGKIKGLKPMLYTYQDVQTLSQMQKLVAINLESELIDEIKSLTDRFDDVRLRIKSQTTIPCATEANKSEEAEDDALQNVKLSSDAFDVRNNQLGKNMHRRWFRDSDLPICNYRDEILTSLENNQVLVIKGDTGCGKSTQVPQFIIDAYTKENRAHECNIIVSEPRRVAAISLAHRVASERGEPLGDVVGYHVRFNKILPPMHGSVLFCTTGILLRRLEQDLKLEGISHIIIDEAHERSLQTDMLLKLFKGTLKHSPHMKLIIMSATVNAELFQQYFSCAIVNVPGKLYPVKMHFMEDIDLFKTESLNSSTSTSSTSNGLMQREIPFDKIVNLIRWIVTSKPYGGILCFLPGWQEIRELHNLLKEIDLDNLLVLPLHSKIPNNIQQKVFAPPPPNVTKIILATDIAETGITITDISYVIDTAIKREIEWNENKSLCSLNFSRISRASISQRKGRAGRVKPGESYHFITRAEYNKLDFYPKPEIFKIPLEAAIITSKTFSNEKAHEFFSSMVESPSEASLNNALKTLKNLGILDTDENLTSLGKRVSCFTLSPKLSKAIILGCIFQCLDPIMSIATVFSTFVSLTVSLDETSVNVAFKDRKLSFHKTSDHIAILQYFNDLKDNSNDKSLFGTFKNSSKVSSINSMQKLCMLYMEDLMSSRMISSTFDLETANMYADNNELIRAVIYASTNQLIKRNSFGYKNGYLTKNANALTAEDNENVKLKSESVNYNRKVWPTELLTYIHKMEYVTRRCCLVTDTSIISPLSVLLFSHGDVKCQKLQRDVSAEEAMILNVKGLQNLQFYCERNTADLLLKLRSILWDVVDFIVEYEGTDSQQENLELVKSYKAELMMLLSKMLEKSSSAIDNMGDDNN